MSRLQSVLSKRNAHVRDKHIQFFEEDHTYKIMCDQDSKYTSVTTWIHQHFEQFDSDSIISSMMTKKSWKPGNKYWGMTPDEIKKQWSDSGKVASGAGTAMHFEIECYMNNSQLPAGYTHADLYNHMPINSPDDYGHFLDTGATPSEVMSSVEWGYFLNFVKDTCNLKPYRTEWTVFNEDFKIAGSIDMIYENADGTLSIYDWKRSKDIVRINTYKKYATTECICHMPDSNFWHYALQLNIYKFILETKYGKVVKDLYLVRLHPDAEEQNYELIKLPILAREVADLFSERHKHVGCESA